LLVGELGKMLHAHQMRAVSTQVIFQVLLITDINEEIIEERALRIRMYRDQDSALEHVLKQRHSFASHGFSTGIGAGYHQQSLVTTELDIEWNDLFPLGFQRNLQDRVPRPSPIEGTLLDQLRLATICLLRKSCFGTDKINQSQKVGGLTQGRYRR